MRRGGGKLPSTLGKRKEEEEKKKKKKKKEILPCHF